MKKATAYALLTRMESAGLVEAEDEREGNRPTRRVYSITPRGTTLMEEMMTAVLQQPVEGLPPGDIAVMYIHFLDPEKAIAALEQRVATMDAQIGELAAAPKHPNVIGVDLAIERRLALLRTDRDWFVRLIERLRSGEIAMPGVVASSVG
jgi:DNA-binding PadR family transcriptional regulator